MFKTYRFTFTPAMHAALKAYAPKVDMRPSQVLRHALVEYWRARGGKHEAAALDACGMSRASSITAQTAFSDDGIDQDAVFGRRLTDEEKQAVQDYGRGWTGESVGAGGGE